MTHAAALSRSHLSFNALLSHSWSIFKKQWKTLVGILVITFLIQGAISILKKTSSDEHGNPMFLMSLIEWAVSTILTMGWLTVYLRVVRGQKVEYTDLFRNYKRFVPYVLGTIVNSVIVFIGFILLIVPGIIWAIRYMFVPYLLVDTKVGVFDALKESDKMTKGLKWKLFGYGIGFLGINILGLIALVVGLAVTIPLTALASALLYTTLSHHKS